MPKPGFFAFKQRLRNSRLDSERLVNVIRLLIILVLGGAVGLLAVPLLPQTAQDWVSSWQQRASEWSGTIRSSQMPTATEIDSSREDVPSPLLESTPFPAQSPTSIPVSVPSPGQRGGADWIGQLETSIHELVNQERRNIGLIALAHDLQLADVARSHSNDMATSRFFDHTNMIGQAPTDRADAAGYDCIRQEGNLMYMGIAENIFSGWLYSSTTRIGLISTRNYLSLAEIADVVVDGWMNSPGHRQNILTPRYSKEGIGISISTDTEAVLVTQNFC